ncbi:MAG: Aspartate-semialdehyde dehydrogenase Acd [Candidatus Methanohalarchaeum thermophilum]|uniref:N-acetyl-gamma-glutamyl-phosphate reductase n=1 Tax=Methanohalarchaeum thermophilum TaxID=1903181 RepID=A0A1Q6DV68_METT1|nr:MAG: Aspartate-semialdehyde dehydrogenase Acd [Candidatus Methanohalarchaeum thermophilum]
MIEAGVVGGSGYTGSELLRIILNHPEFELKFATSRSYSGERIGDILPSLERLTDQSFVSPSKEQLEGDLVFTAVPHTKAMEYVPYLVENCSTVVDLSADYRIPTREFEEVYGAQHSDPGRECIYGLTELNREKIAVSSFVANPGCFPTGACLSVLPLLEEDGVNRILFDSKTGISGAGAKPTESTHFPNVQEEVSPYNVTSHRHLSEMKMVVGGNNRDVYFTPHIIPSTRGILTTSHLFDVSLDEDEVFKLFKDYYDDDYFVRVKKDVPKLSSVRGSNFVDIGGFEIKEGRLVVVSAIDNLVKGAAGQAIQNANIMNNLDEKLGLDYAGLSP